jgi:hypothetical protein
VEDVLQVTQASAGVSEALVARLETACAADSTRKAVLKALDGSDRLSRSRRRDGLEDVLDMGVEVDDGRDEAERVEVGSELCKKSVSEKNEKRRKQPPKENERSWMTVRVDGGTMPTNCSMTVLTAVL